MIGHPAKIYNYFSSRYVLSAPSPKGWYTFDCPVCGGKKKRAVHLFYEITKCWTCSFRGSVEEFIESTENLESSYEAKRRVLELADSALDVSVMENITYTKVVTSKVTMPVGYKSLLEGDSALARRARAYLSSRGFDLDRLDSKGFGYSNKHYNDPDDSKSFSKDFFGYIIIPFTKDGILQYYIGRDFLGRDDFRYKNPPADFVGVGKSEVIYNEAALYLHDEVGIFEGWADAETLGDTGTATLGWSLSQFQINKYLNCPAKKLVFFPDAGVDGDGVSFYKKAVRAATTFLDMNKEIVVVDMNKVASGDKKDLNSIGLKPVQDLYYRTRPLTWAKAMKILNSNS